MVNGPDDVFVERGGRIERVQALTPTGSRPSAAGSSRWAAAGSYRWVMVGRSSGRGRGWGRRGRPAQRRRRRWRRSHVVRVWRVRRRWWCRQYLHGRGRACSGRPARRRVALGRVRAWLGARVQALVRAIARVRLYALEARPGGRCHEPVEPCPQDDDDDGPRNALHDVADAVFVHRASDSLLIWPPPRSTARHGVGTVGETGCKPAGGSPSDG